ncbi:hypothetical protein LCGC14_1032410 [marine sediment metagenome]|uniref:Uncharacterized protein n=1 Tax=marine sediment metagenome TaxID=412755 RepID=A0A0F9MU90_9ZZZZ
MGLFDTFSIPAKCTNCGTMITDWQTKELDCLMNNFQLGDRINRIDPIGVYGDCANVGNNLNW